MRQIVVIALATGLAVSPIAAGQVPGAATQSQAVIGETILSTSQAVISGVVVTPDGQPLANTVIRARSLLTGGIGESTSTGTAGEFALSINPGSYVLEVVDAGGQIVGTSSFIFAAAGTAVTASTVTAISGALGVASSATGLAATLGAGAPSVGLAAAAAGVAGVVAPLNTPMASPSR